MKNIVEYALFLFIATIFRLLGLKFSRKFAILLADFFFYFIPIRKRVVIDNIRNCFPEKTDDEIRIIAKNSYRSFSITFAELLLLPYLEKDEILSLFDCSNIEHFYKEYEKGDGVIMLTAHFGNWELGVMGMNLVTKIPMYVMAKDQRNHYVDKFVTDARERFGNKMVKLGVSIRNIYSELKKKNVIGIAGDQRGPKDGLRVDFLGRSTSVFNGPAALSLKLNVPIICFFMVRNSDYSYNLRFFKLEASINDNDSEEIKIKAIMQCYFSILEKQVRVTPEQYLWMHKRWKH